MWPWRVNSAETPDFIGWTDQVHPENPLCGQIRSTPKMFLLHDVTAVTFAPENRVNTWMMF
jgi:hypothetical protein